MTIDTDTINTHQEMAKIILSVQQAIQSDEKVINNWNSSREAQKTQWDNLPEKEKQQKRAMGMEFVDKQINPVQLRNNTRAYRRKLRYKLFRVREHVANGTIDTDQELLALKTWYEKQFRAGWSFANFTFEWDISAVDPLKIVSPFEWDGEVTDQALRIENGSKVIGKFCDPTAFTNQEM